MSSEGRGEKKRAERGVRGGEREGDEVGVEWGSGQRGWEGGLRREGWEVEGIGKEGKKEGKAEWRRRRVGGNKEGKWGTRIEKKLRRLGRKVEEVKRERRMGMKEGKIRGRGGGGGSRGRKRAKKVRRRQVTGKGEGKCERT